MSKPDSRGYIHTTIPDCPHTGMSRHSVQHKGFPKGTPTGWPEDWFGEDLFTGDNNDRSI